MWDYNIRNSQDICTITKPAKNRVVLQKQYLCLKSEVSNYEIVSAYSFWTDMVSRVNNRMDLQPLSKSKGLSGAVFVSRINSINSNLAACNFEFI